MHYDLRLRPAQPPTPSADAFEIRRDVVRDGLSLAYVREGIGGYPLLLVHGYPETKRIWWRNIEPLVAAGYEVIVPDLRGFGDSDLSPRDEYDIAAYSRDLVPGTIIGSGTVSNDDFRVVGSSCIAERRAIETLDEGAARTPYMSFGDRVRLQARGADGRDGPFGAIDQQVVRAGGGGAR